MDEPKIVHADRQFITAELARRWMKLNIDNNRQLNNDRINQYARDMKASKWRENGVSIKFADDGALIDGQHRLLACIQSGCGFWSLVAYGIKREALLTIDRGQPRTRGQVLRLESGLSDQNAVAATLAWLFRFRDGIMLQGATCTDTEMAELLVEHPGVKDSISAARKVIHQFKAGSISVVAICHYLFTRQDATLAELFFDSLAKGTGLREIDPVYQLRKRMISFATSGRRTEAHAIIALYFKSWNAEREQRTMNSLQWQASESFPNIGPVGTAKMRPEKVQELAKKQQSTRVARRKSSVTVVSGAKERPAANTGSAARLDALIAKQRGLDNQSSSFRN
jgi:hypothetical protein